jgi:hypothetical protein
VVSSTRVGIAVAVEEWIVSYEVKRGGSSVASGGDRGVTGSAPGKRTLTEGLPTGAPVQRKPTGPASPAPDAPEGQVSTGAVHAAAARGVDGPGSGLPFASQIQASFGPRHDVSAMQAHVGGAAAEASTAMGASAYATGNHVAFASAPDLHTAAHEAAHVVQQAHGVSLYGGVGQPGDRYEQHADAVADRVVAGQSAADLLDGPGSAGAGMADPGVQRRSLAENLRDALVGPAPAAAATAPVQMTLSTTLRASLEVYGPVDYNGLVAMIHAAPTAERQAVLSDGSLRDLINSRLNREWASTVFSSLMEGSQSWRNPPQSDFYAFFITGNGNGPMPNTATMNCWEAILYAAFLARQVTATWIRTFYTTATSAPPADITATFWQLLHFSTSLPRYAPPASSGTGGGVGAPGTGATVTPRAGQLLFYHSGGAIPAHVAVSLGGDQAISLWNQPNNIASVQRIQATAISGTIYVGDPPW